MDRVDFMSFKGEYIRLIEDPRLLELGLLEMLFGSAQGIPTRREEGRKALRAGVCR